MLKYSVEVKDRPLNDDLRFIKKNLGKLVGTPVIKETGDRIVQIAKTLAPAWKGTLRTSIKWVEVKKDNKVQQINISAKAMSPEGIDYAPFTEFPTKPHWVSLRKHPSMRDWLEDKEGKGEFFYGQSVFVKGSKRPYWLRDSVNQVEAQLESIADKTLIKFIQHIGR